MARPMRMLLLLVAALAALVVVPVAAAWGGGGGGGGTTANTFSGRATVLAVDVLGVETTVVDTGDVPASGGTLEQDAACYPVEAPGCGPIALPDITGGLLSGGVLHAMVVAGGNQSRAEASFSEFGLILGEGDQIAGEFAEAQATATCTNGVPSVAGVTSVTNLTVAGVTIAVTGAANQVVPLPGGGQIIINEQVSSTSGNYAEITVTALRIAVPGEIDVRIARAHADIRCGTGGTPPPTCKPKYGGHGGYKPPQGNRFSFAFAVDEDNQGWGHLIVSQQDLGLTMSATPSSVSAYTRPGDVKASRLTIGGPVVDGRRFGLLTAGWMEMTVDLDAAGDKVKVVLLTAPRAAGGIVLQTLESYERLSYGGVRVYT